MDVGALQHNQWDPQRLGCLVFLKVSPSFSRILGNQDLDLPTFQKSMIFFDAERSLLPEFAKEERRPVPILAGIRWWGHSAQTTQLADDDPGAETLPPGDYPLPARCAYRACEGSDFFNRIPTQLIPNQCRGRS